MVPGLTQPRRRLPNGDEPAAAAAKGAANAASNVASKPAAAAKPLRGSTAGTGSLGLLATAIAVSVYMMVATLICSLAPSSPAAVAASQAPDLASGYLAGFVAFATYLANELLGLGLHADRKRLQTSAPPLGIAICGTFCAAMHWLGRAPLAAQPGLATVVVVTPLRHVTWCFTTSLLSFCTWSASGLPSSRYLLCIGVDVPMILSGLASSLTAGALSWALYAVSCITFVIGLWIKWNMQGYILADCEGLDKARAAVIRMRWMSLVVWNLFPAVDILHRLGLVGNVGGELLIAASDVSAKCLLASSLKHGILCSSDDRRVARMQEMSMDLVEQLRGQEKRKDRFFAAMTHELRTPLNGILGLLDVLLMTEKNMSERCKQSLNRASETGRRFQTLINSILDSASIAENKLTLDKDPMSVHQLVDEVSTLIEPIVRANVQMRVEMPDSLPLIDGDYNRMVQVLFNLMGNAAKFTEAGHVTVGAKVADQKNMVEIYVADSGIGIKEEDYEIIFEPFEQVDAGHTRSYGGAGLGLSLAMKLVKAHGGTLDVKSVLGIGTRFTIKVPIYRDAAGGDMATNAAILSRAEPQRERLNMRRPTVDSVPEGAQLPEPQPLDSVLAKGATALSKRRGSSGSGGRSDRRMSTCSSTGGSGRHLRKDIAARAAAPNRLMPAPTGSNLAPTEAGVKKTFEILSVDDDNLNQEVIGEIITAGGYSVTKAMSGQEALQLLADRYVEDGMETFPDIILMDLMMPGMTGLEATKTIRDRYPTWTVPIIMVSAVNHEKDICAGLQAGCNDYVTKPYRHMELMARIGLQLRIVEFYQRELESRQHERILQEILPLNVIERLKQGQTAIADEHNQVTVVFSDIVGFTELAARHSTPEIINMLDSLFTTFDELVEQHYAYKVETIGDAYMVACGLDGDEDHALNAVNLAADMMSAASMMTAPNGQPLRIRVGLHTGPAYAGVVGQKCPRYCLFGDTVNTASRMESNGFPVTVHISDSVRQAVNGSMSDSEFYDMGERPIKGKGMMRTWLLKEGQWEEAVEEFNTMASATSSTHTLYGAAMYRRSEGESKHHVMPLMERSSS